MLGSATPIFEKKNVIVTGGAGFLGSHLCEKLLQSAKVICIDNLLNSNIQNIDHLLQYPDFEFIKYDVNNPIDLDQFEELDKFKVKFQGVQEIYHLACPTSPKNFEQLKLNSLLANSTGMISTLDLAVKYKAKYLFTSSAVVYGEVTPEKSVFVESDEGVVDHLSSRGCYNEGKRFAETCVETYRQVYGIDVKIARVFNTYGPRMKLRDGLLVPDFILSAIEDENLVVYGDPEMGFSFCYISDMIDGLLKLMQTGPEMSIVNLGSDQFYKISEVADMVLKMTNSSSKVVYEPPIAMFMHQGKPNLQRAKEMLGWIPLVRLTDGLRNTIDYTIASKGLVEMNESQPRFYR